MPLGFGAVCARAQSGCGVPSGQAKGLLLQVQELEDALLAANELVCC